MLGEETSGQKPKKTGGAERKTSKSKATSQTRETQKSFETFLGIGVHSEPLPKDPPEVLARSTKKDLKEETNWPQPRKITAACQKNSRAKTHHHGGWIDSSFKEARCLKTEKKENPSEDRNQENRTERQKKALRHQKRGSAPAGEWEAQER